MDVNVFAGSLYRELKLTYMAVSFDSQVFQLIGNIYGEFTQKGICQFSLRD